MLNGSHIIKGKWKIVKKIGQGAFGEIYQAKNIITSEMVAIKVERVDSKKQVLKLEVAVLKKLQDSAFVCRFITCGRFSEYNYMVMELLSENISELRRKQPEGKFSLPTTLRLGQQMLRAIQTVHDLGYLHRDIKPSNFAMGLGPTKKRMVFIIDFGLARRYLLPTGEIRPARESAGFRGTARYASINSHLSKDLGRRDDLWSLFYVLIEFLVGNLPWRKLKDKDQIGEIKVQYNNAELVKDLPPEFLKFMEHLLSLQFADRPDYDYLYSLLQKAYINTGSNENTPLDWEVQPETISVSTARRSRQPSYVNTNTSNSKQQSLKNENTNDEKLKESPQSKLSLPLTKQDGKTPISHTGTIHLSSSPVSPALTPPPTTLNIHQNPQRRRCSSLPLEIEKSHVVNIIRSKSDIFKPEKFQKSQTILMEDISPIQSPSIPSLQIETPQSVKSQNMTEKSPENAEKKCCSGSNNNKTCIIQ